MVHFFFALLVLTATARAQVVETPTTAEALSHVDKDTLLIFDLDNTVIMPAQMLGGEEWFDARVDELIKEGKDKPTVIRQALAEWNAIQRATEVVPVEAAAPKLIAAKQAAGAKTMGLTARPADLVAVTHRQMKTIGIEFGKATISPTKFAVKGTDEAPFDNGIVFVGALNNKGDILVKVLDKLKLQPKKIVFVDNKRNHVENVEKALARRGIDYVGCRLGASDAKIAAFDPEIAAAQNRYFQKILSNDAAAALVKAGLGAK